MTISKYEELDLKVWLDGQILRYADAKVPILTHSLQYGSGMFEGLRAYPTSKGTAIFRLHDHVTRFANTAKIYNMKLGYSIEELENAIISVVRENKLDSCYIRPFAFYNDDRIGLSPLGKKISVFIAAVPFGKYLSGDDAGIKCKISSWKRINSDILPIEAKASGNYINSILANIEARNSDFDEAIMLSQNGYLAEGPGENIFLVKDKTLITPGVNADILLGITRDTIIKLAESLNLKVVERNVHREELYTSDEVFFCGTAAEITAITNIDGIVIGAATAGEVTKLIKKMYYELITGKLKEFSDLLTYI